MKKLLFIFGIIAAFSFAVQAQDAFVSSNGTNFNVTLDAGDTISETGSVSKVISLGAKQSVQLYSIMVTLETVSDTPAETIVLAGSMDNETYSTITSVSWAGTSADTTFYYTDISTGVAWPYLRVSATEGGTAKGKMTTLRGRCFDEVK